MWEAFNRLDEEFELVEAQTEASEEQEMPINHLEILEQNIPSLKEKLGWDDYEKLKQFVDWLWIEIAWMKEELRREKEYQQYQQAIRTANEEIIQIADERWDYHALEAAEKEQEIKDLTAQLQATSIGEQAPKDKE